MTLHCWDSEFVFKSDNEPSIVALKEAVKSERAERIVLEASPVYESKSNGVIERAVQQVQGQVRTVKDGLESRIGERLLVDSQLVPWIVLHAAHLINCYHVGPDGKTNFRRWKGKDFRNSVVEFGESVMYLKAGSKGRDKLDCRWEQGVWLGMRLETGESVIGTDLGVVKCRDIKRLGSSDERWNRDRLLAVQGTPWEPTLGKVDDRIPVRVHMPEEGEPAPIETGVERAIVSRRASIHRHDIIRFGYTHNCPGCQAISRNAPSQNHTEQCRERIEG